MNFADGTVVHINAPIAGLVGASILWVDWFGFNAVSALEANGVAALAFVNTFFATATAAAVLSWTAIEWLARGKPSMFGGAGVWDYVANAASPGATPIRPVSERWTKSHRFPEMSAQSCENARPGKPGRAFVRLRLRACCTMLFAKSTRFKHMVATSIDRVCCSSMSGTRQGLLGA